MRRFIKKSVSYSKKNAIPTLGKSLDSPLEIGIFLTALQIFCETWHCPTLSVIRIYIRGECSLKCYFLSKIKKKIRRQPPPPIKKDFFGGGYTIPPPTQPPLTPLVVLQSTIVRAGMVWHRKNKFSEPFWAKKIPKIQ